MGNICGKEEPEASPPGRVLGSAPPAQRKSSVPRKVGGPPRTLGGGASSGDAGAEGSGDLNTADARRKAAEAAEARAKASKQGGKLSSQLAAQKRQSRSDTLKQLSADERREREIAAHEAENRNFN